MNETGPLSGEEIAGFIQRRVNAAIGFDLADAPVGASFELTAPATGQRFRVTVTEVPAGEAVDAAIAAFCGGEQS
jgi:hypothetical protein